VTSPSAPTTSASDTSLGDRNATARCGTRSQKRCVQGCSARALVFGDLNDPESDVARLSRLPRGGKLLEDLGTLPNVTYLERQTEV